MLTWTDVFLAEYEQLHGPLPPAEREKLLSGVANSGDQATLLALNQRAFASGQSALCLSGGGVRSASFSIGVLQAMGRLGLLPRFEYLSTVSGGGFAGAWLTAWRRRAQDDQAARVQLAELEGADAQPCEVNRNLSSASASTSATCPRARDSFPPTSGRSPRR
ncbi:hypothetical protein BH18ACI5_BH18ACI5_10430 [soil metagenome]